MSRIHSDPLRSFLVALTVFASLTGASSPCYCGTADLLTRASGALVGGRYETAEGLFSEALAEDRLCAVAECGRGAALMFRGDAERASDGFARALEMDGSLRCGQLGAGTAACLRGRYSEAMGHFRAAGASVGRYPAPALAGEAYAACALGLYDTALQQATAALNTAPEDPVALHVVAAASLARGDGYPASRMDGNYLLPPGSVRSPVFLPSCLLEPGTAYWQRHDAEDGNELARLGLGAVPRETLFAPRLPDPNRDFVLREPVMGQTLSDRAIVRVAVGPSAPVKTTIVRVDQSFAGGSAGPPFDVAVDTRLLDDGPAELRVDGHDGYGRLVRSAAARVVIRNGNRTLAPDETRVRQAVGELLERMLLPPPSPMATKQLAGHGLLKMGRAEEAVSCFESAYATRSDLPGLRADLLLAYHALGLPLAAKAPEVVGLSGPGKRVAITFDDGPHPMITPWILDELDKHHAKATFFLVGKQATLYPELVREIVRRGHAIGSHSHAHYSLRNLDQSACEQDLVKSRLALREASGQTVRLFRPPGGYYDDGVRKAAGALGFTTVFWTANITSFPGRDGKRIATELARQCANGGIILLHNGEDETLDALPHLIPALREHKVTLVTLTSADATPVAQGGVTGGAY